MTGDPMDQIFGPHMAKLFRNLGFSQVVKLDARSNDIGDPGFEFVPDDPGEEPLLNQDGDARPAEFRDAGFELVADDDDQKAQPDQRGGTSHRADNVVRVDFGAGPRPIDEADENGSDNNRFPSRDEPPGPDDTGPEAA